MNCGKQRPDDISGFDTVMRGLVGVQPSELEGQSAREQAKAVIREIVRLSGGRLLGKTRLYKVFYFSHLYYAKRREGYLTEWPIVRMPHGPGIDEGDSLLTEMEHERAIESRSVDYGPYPSIEFRSSRDDIPHVLSLDAIEAIRDAVMFAKGKSAAELSELTHEHSHSWRDAADGEELDFQLDLLSAKEYEERKASMARTAEALLSVW